MTDTTRAPATEEKVTELEQYVGRKELSEVPPRDDDEIDRWYFSS